MPHGGLRQRLLEDAQLRLPPDKTGEAPGSGGLEAPAQATGPEQRPDLHGGCQGRDGQRSYSLDLHQSCHQVHGRSREQNRVRRRPLRHAYRQVRGQPQRGVLHRQAVGQGAYHDVASVEANVALQHHAMGAAEVLSIGAEGRLQGQCRITGPCRVIFLGSWGAKDRHHPATAHLCHGALIPVHGLQHGVQGGIEELLGRFGVEVADEGQCFGDLREQDGDLLAFAAQDDAGHVARLSQRHRRGCQQPPRRAGDLVGVPRQSPALRQARARVQPRGVQAPGGVEALWLTGLPAAARSQDRTGQAWTQPGRRHHSSSGAGQTQCVATFGAVPPIEHQLDSACSGLGMSLVQLGKIFPRYQNDIT